MRKIEKPPAIFEKFNYVELTGELSSMDQNSKLTPATILQLHQIITSNTMANKQEEGAFRQSDDVRIVDVQTGFVLHRPPDHEHLNKLMVEFCSFANDNKKEDFFLNDCTYFILYNLKCIVKALEELKVYIARKNQEKKNALELLRHTDYNDRQISLLQDILNDRKNIFTVSEVQTRFGVSNQTARNDLNHLVAKGVLEARKNGYKTQFLLSRHGEKRIMKRSGNQDLSNEPV
jgi:Fic family protein